MVKYRIPYKSFDNSDWLITIDMPLYDGDPIQVRGSADNAGTLYYEGGIDDVWDNPMVNVILNSVIINQGQVNVRELQRVNDRECIVVLTRNEEVRFKGFLDSREMQGSLSATPYTVTLSATSGLNLLEGITYVPFTDDLGTRCPLNYFRRILCHPENLGIDLPIRWTPTVSAIAEEISGDAFVNALWSADDEGYMSIDIKTEEIIYKDCNYIIEGLSKALQCRVVQDGGAWWIIGINEHASDVISYKECVLSTGIPVITEHTRDSVQTIGDYYGLIHNDAAMTVSPALGRVTVIYDQDHRDNIIPNGGQDIWLPGLPKWWEYQGSGVNVITKDDLTGQGGFSAQVTNLGNQEAIYKFTGSLPVDANILYRKLSWGFTFMPIDGFRVDQNGTIDWKNDRIKTSVKYTVYRGGQVLEFFLNEFGFWSEKNLEPGAWVSGYDWHSSGGGTLSVIFDQGRDFFVGDEVTILAMRDGNPEAYTIIFDAPMSVQDGVNHVADQIPNASNSNAWTVDLFGVDNSTYNHAFSRKSFDYYRYIYFEVDNLAIDDVASINFRGNSGLDVYLVDPGPLNEDTPDGVGLLSVEFYIQPGKVVVLDDVWMKFDDNSDKYIASVAGTSNTKSQEIRMNISSSFNGFYVSNLMRNYHSNDEDWLYSYKGQVGSLTELYARSVMMAKSKPRDIFEGTINTRGRDWSFLDNYRIDTFDGDKYIPVNPTYNTEKNEVKLYAIECSENAVTVDVKHEGTEKNNEI